MRTASSTSVTKILPSPIFPVLAAPRIASTARCARIVRNNYLELRFWKEIHRVLGAAINFAVPLLAAKSFHLTESHSFYACCHQRFFHRLGFKWLDDGLDFLHRAKLNPAGSQMASARAASNATRSNHVLLIITVCVRIFSPARPAKSGSWWAVRADSNRADRSRANRGSVFPLQDNATDHWL